MPHLFSACRTAALLVSCAALAAAAAEPKAALLHNAPRDWKAGEVFQVDGSLTGSTAFDKLVLRYRGPGEEYVDVKMELQYGDLYRGTIPAARMRPPGIEYYVEGVTESGERVAIFSSAGKPSRVLVLGEDAAVKRVEPEPKEEPPPEVKSEPAKKPKKKCKKKDKKCREEEALEAASAAGEKKSEPKKEEPKQEEPKKEEPKKEEPRAEEPKREEPKKEAGKKENGKKEAPKKEEPVEEAPKKDEPAKKAEPPRKRSELEEELAIYGAEDSSGVVTRIDDKTSRVPQAITRYTSAHLKQLGARTVYDVLDLIEGLTVSRDVQGFHRVAVRGIRSDPEVLFLLDGHKLNNFYDGRSLANLPIDNLEQIEVYRGPATANFGLGNFLAVVTLATRRDDGVRAGAGAGLWETYEGHLGVAKTFGGLKLHAEGDVVKQLGYRKPVTKDALDINTVAQGKRLAQEPAGKTNDSRLLVNAGGGVEFAREGFGKLSLDARFLLETRGALIGQYDTLGTESKLDWNVLLIDLVYERKLGEASRLRARVFYDQQASQRHFQLSPREYRTIPNNDAYLFPEGIVEEVSVSTRTLGAELGAELSLPANNRLGLGVSFDLSSLTGYGYLTNYEPGTNLYKGPALTRPAGLLYPTEGTGAAASRLGIGIFAQDTFTPFERLTIELGVRADLVQLPTASGGAITGSGIAAGFGPRAGIVFAPINSLALKAHYGRAFRAPTPQELAETIPNSDSNQGRFVGNPALAPAYVDSVEAGFEYAQTVGDARLKLRAAGFFENFSNPIHPVDKSGNLAPITNRLQGVRVFGGEAEARLELSQRSAVFVNASFFRAEDNAVVAAARL
ncbi:MAG: TonB-dependent receptor, partial [Myxococcaceae bacterium]|nr:TonB-dependent receptor [Myxococcaceae bacterium]